MKSLAMLRKAIIPRPVYEAHMDNGQRFRLSFWSQQGKPLAIDRARGLFEAFAACPGGNMDGLTVVDGYVENLGERFRDPYFEPQTTIVPVKKRRVTAKELRGALEGLLAWVEGDGPRDPSEIMQQARELLV